MTVLVVLFLIVAVFVLILVVLRADVKRLCDQMIEQDRSGCELSASRANRVPGREGDGVSSASDFTWSNTNTWSSSGERSLLMRVVQDEGQWIVSDFSTDVYGSGDSLLEALCDYYAALRSTASVLDDKPLVPRLQRELRKIHWLLGLTEKKAPDA